MAAVNLVIQVSEPPGPDGVKVPVILTKFLS